MNVHINFIYNKPNWKPCTFVLIDKVVNSKYYSSRSENFQQYEIPRFLDACYHIDESQNKWVKETCQIQTETKQTKFYRIILYENPGNSY